MIRDYRAMLMFNDKDLTLLIKNFNENSNSVLELMDLVNKYANMSLVDVFTYLATLKPAN